jgi:hypothetical protein
MASRVWPEEGGLVRRGVWLVAGLALAVALPVRFLPLLGADFPLNDGGLFVAMGRDLIDSGFRLPLTTSYNGGTIPFAYPPFAIYFAAVLSSATGIGLPALLRFLPLLVNLTSVVAVAVLARRLLPLPASLFAALAFPLFPASFEWLVMGAGLTRSFGFFFAILGLFFGHKLFVMGGRGNLALAAIFASLSVVSHPGAGAFGLVGLLTFFLVLSRDRRGFVSLLGVCVGCAVLTAPWWGTVLVRHGVGPLTAAAAATEPSQTVATFASLLLLGGTDSPLLSVVALLGVFVSVARARWLLPLWLLATAVLVRNLTGPPLALILALLVGEAMGALILPGLGAPGEARWRSPSGGPPVAAPATGGDQGHPTARWARLALVTLLLGQPILAGLSRQVWGVDALQFIGAQERTAMDWVITHTPGSSRFLVLTAARSWAEDPASEWFPALAKRASLATPQGFEWVPGPQYRRRGALYDRLKQCFPRDATCIESLAAELGAPFTHVYFSKALRGPYDPAPLAIALARSSRYRLIWDGSEAAVFMRLSP